MRLSILIAVLAPIAFAAPTYDEWKPAKAHDSKAVAAYFKSLARCVGESKVAGVAPVCDLSKAVMPICMSQPPSSTPLQQLTSIV